MKTKLLPFLFLLVGTSFVVAGSVRDTSASHYTNWLHLRAPFNGYWNKAICPPPSGQCAPPASHHTPYGGDWATDYYQTPDTAGSFRISNSNGGTAYGVVAPAPGSSCKDATWAGWKYRFSVYDGAGSRGWYLVSHVADTVGPGTPYVLQQNQTVYNGTLIGWTAYWGTSSCYNVSTFGGVHWHVEMFQPTHYSCWYPWAPGAALTTSDVLGVVGSNALTKQSCY